MVVRKDSGLRLQISNSLPKEYFSEIITLLLTSIADIQTGS